MSTIIRRLPGVNADSAGLSPISINQDEVDLLINPNLLHWWDAGHGFVGGKWRCRKTGAQLVTELSNGVPPTLQPSLSAYNGAPSLLFSSLSRLWDGGADLFPAGEFTMVFVGRPGPNDDAFIMGARTEGNSVTTRFVWLGADANTGAQALVVNGSSAATQLDGKKYVDGPFVNIASHKADESVGAKAAIRRISLASGAVLDVTANPAATANTHTEFTVGAVNSGDLLGDLGTVMIFNKALHLNTDLRDLVQSVISARYSIGV